MKADRAATYELRKCNYAYSQYNSAKSLFKSNNVYILSIVCTSDKWILEYTWHTDSLQSFDQGIFKSIITQAIKGLWFNPTVRVVDVICCLCMICWCHRMFWARRGVLLQRAVIVIHHSLQSLSLNSSLFSPSTQCVLLSSNMNL